MTGVIGKDRQLNTKHGKAANAGFSLVELLIAVTILAIIVIPLLHMFVTSTRINVKSRQTLRATTVAQDIMEGLKAYTLDEVRTQFSLPNGKISDSFFYPTEGFYIVNSKMIEGGVREVRQLETDRNDDGEFDDPDNPNNEIYYFAIEKLKMQGGEYDALIKLDASTYTKKKVIGVGGSGPSADAHDNYYNGTFYADIQSVSETNGNSEKDSSYHEHSEMNKNVLANIKEQIKEHLDENSADAAHYAQLEAYELEDLIEKRNITVEIEAEGSDECKATITFEYICSDPFGYNPAGKYVSYGKAGSTSGLVGGEDKYIRTFSSGNFYLFYYPIYTTGANIDNIEFKIKNPADLFDDDHPLLKSITLAEQIRSTVETSTADPSKSVIVPELEESDLKGKEDSYHPRVNLITTGDGSLDAGKLVFRTNVITNMVSGEDVLALFEGLLADDDTIELIEMTGDVVSDKITDVIYDVEITVYKTGAAQYFDTPNFEDRPEVQRLASITNLD